ncbi:MAG TPA: TonB-dependent receptor plug domain-containing protein [Bacteroidales bacterium]|nr:TonB-dependent receptor plug domain-containing protein [Bacteroidales bacterium]
MRDNFKLFTFGILTIALFCNLPATALNENKDTILKYVSKNLLAGPSICIDSSAFNRSLIINPLELISGKVPGLILSSNDGRPGTDYNLINRGISSFYTNMSPLIVVNDLEIEIGQVKLNPHDVESITILKGVLAYAIYGEKAANGAIVIKTKRPGKEFKAAYTGNYGLSYLPEKVDVFSANEFKELLNKYADEQAISLAGNSNTNWQDEIYRTAFLQDHHLSLSGKYKFLPVLLAFGRTNQDGIIKTSSYKRTTIYLSTKPNFFNDHLIFDINFNSIFNNNQLADESAISNAIFFDPTQPVYNNSRFGGYFTWSDSNNEPIAWGPDNPVAQLEQINSTSKTKQHSGNFRMDYKLHFFPDLKIGFYYGIEKITDETIRDIDTAAAWLYWVYLPANQHNKQLINGSEQKKDVYLNYSAQTKKENFKIDIIAGYYTLNQSIKIKSNEFKTIKKTSQASAYFRLNSLIAKKLLINISACHESSEDGHYEQMSKPSYTGSLKWNLLKPSILKKNRTISELGLRAEYGSTDYFQPFSYPSIWDLFMWGGNMKLNKEKVSSFDAGIDFGFAENKVYGKIDYYSKISDDLIIINSSLFTNSFRIFNGGKIQNKGVEVMLNALLLSNNKWEWKISLNAAYNKNKILSLEKITGFFYGYSDRTASVGVKEWQILSQHPGSQVNSYFVLKQVYDQDNHPLEGIYANIDNGYTDLTSYYRNRYLYNNANPEIISGISSSLNFKNWDFSFSGRIFIGNYLYNLAGSESYYYRLIRDDYLQNITTMVKDSRFVSSQYLSDYYVENASFLRMDYMSLGYSFNNTQNSKFSLHLSGNITNAFTITKYKGQDPEEFRGMDNYKYPRPRIFSLGLIINY